MLLGSLLPLKEEGLLPASLSISNTARPSPIPLDLGHGFFTGCVTMETGMEVQVRLLLPPTQCHYCGVLGADLFLVHVIKEK